jgi:hypothetical protein
MESLFMALGIFGTVIYFAVAVSLLMMPFIAFYFFIRCAIKYLKS